MKQRYTRFKDINNSMKQDILDSIFSNNIKYKDVKFNYLCTDISGSKAIELYTKYILKNDIEIGINDIDIYIQINKDNIKKIKFLLFTLLSDGYIYKNFISPLSAYEKIENIINLAFKLKDFDFKNDLKEKNYFSLASHISAIFSLKNPDTNKNVDVIITKTHIRQMLLETFDYDIVKNYYHNGYLYILNPDAIKNKIATMTEKHLQERVFNNMYELSNFIKRYKKYSSRGYTIYVNNNLINLHFINQLERYCDDGPIIFYPNTLTIYSILNLNAHKENYNNTSGTFAVYIYKCAMCMLFDIYYTKFYIHKELIETVYHPSNLFKKSNEYLLDEE
jgi:hypothetical protein